MDFLSVHCPEACRAHPAYQGNSTADSAVNVVTRTLITRTIPAGNSMTFGFTPYVLGGAIVFDGQSNPNAIYGMEYQEHYTTNFSKVNYFDGSTNADISVPSWTRDAIQNTGPSTPIQLIKAASANASFASVSPPFATNAALTRATHLSSNTDAAVQVPFGGQAMVYQVSRGDVPQMFGSSLDTKEGSYGDSDDSVTFVRNRFLTCETWEGLVTQTSRFAGSLPPTVCTGASKTASTHVNLKSGPASPNHWFAMGSTSMASGSRQVVPLSGSPLAPSYAGLVCDQVDAGGSYSTSRPPFCQYFCADGPRVIPRVTATIEYTSDLSKTTWDATPPVDAYEARKFVTRAFGYNCQDLARTCTGMIHVKNSGTTDIVVTINHSDRYAVRFQPESVVGNLMSPTLNAPHPQNDELLSGSGAGASVRSARMDALRNSTLRHHRHNISIPPDTLRTAAAHQSDYLSSEPSALIPDTGRGVTQRFGEIAQVAARTVAEAAGAAVRNNPRGIIESLFGRPRDDYLAIEDV